MILPDFVSYGYRTFNGWYKDAELTIKFTDPEVESDTSLYGEWKVIQFAVTLDVNGGDQLPRKEITVKLNDPYGCLLTPTRTGYTFLGWFTDDSKLITSESLVTIEEDHTLIARWSPNKYIATLDPNGGELTVKEVTVTFGEAYGLLPTPKKSEVLIPWVVQ